MKCVISRLIYRFYHFLAMQWKLKKLWKRHTGYNLRESESMIVHSGTTEL
jgi:hypothetical protein